MLPLLPPPSLDITVRFRGSTVGVRPPRLTPDLRGPWEMGNDT